MNEKLVAFLYMLMRDEVVPGVVARIAQEIDGHAAIGSITITPRFSFSNPHLEAYATELAKRLTQ